MRLLRAADRTAVPWKNGGGVTRDVIVWPAGATARNPAGPTPSSEVNPITGDRGHGGGM